MSDVILKRNVLSTFLSDVAEGEEGVDEALDGGSADAGEAAGKGLRAIGLLPRGLVDHAAHKGDLVGKGGPLRGHFGVFDFL